MNAAEIREWTRANLRARQAYYAQPIAACVGIITGRDGVERPCEGIGDEPDNLCRVCRPAPVARPCPSCGRMHIGSLTCGACRQRAWRAAQKVAKKVRGPQMERRYWLTEQGYAVLAEIEGRTA